jgi:hypothetical protein
MPLPSLHLLPSTIAVVVSVAVAIAIVIAIVIAVAVAIAVAIASTVAIAIAVSPLSAGGYCHTSAIFFACHFFCFLIVDC